MMHMDEPVKWLRRFPNGWIGMHTYHTENNKRGLFFLEGARVLDTGYAFRAITHGWYVHTWPPPRRE
jgi:hypothetical protein